MLSWMSLKMKREEEERELHAAYLQQKSAVKSKREKYLDDAIKMETFSSALCDDASKSLGLQVVEFGGVEDNLRSAVLDAEKIAQAGRQHETREHMAIRNEVQSHIFRGVFNYIDVVSPSTFQVQEMKTFFSTDEQGRDIIQSLEHHVNAPGGVDLAEMIFKAKVSDSVRNFRAISTADSCC